MSFQSSALNLSADSLPAPRCPSPPSGDRPGPAHRDGRMVDVGQVTHGEANSFKP